MSSETDNEECNCNQALALKKENEQLKLDLDTFINHNLQSSSERIQRLIEKYGNSLW